MSPVRLRKCWRGWLVPWCIQRPARPGRCLCGGAPRAWSCSSVGSRCSMRSVVRPGQTSSCTDAWWWAISTVTTVGERRPIPGHHFRARRGGIAGGVRHRADRCRHRFPRVVIHRTIRDEQTETRDDLEDLLAEVRQLRIEVAEQQGLPRRTPAAPGGCGPAAIAPTPSRAGKDTASDARPQRC